MVLLGRYAAANNEPFTYQVAQLSADLGVTVEKAEIAGVTVYWVTPPVIAPQNKDRLYVHMHGGGFSLGYAEAAPFEAISIAIYAQMPAILIDYRTTPLHPFPAALDDVLAVYQELLKDYDPAAMAIGGGSAGGNLAMASITTSTCAAFLPLLPILAAHLGRTSPKKGIPISSTKGSTVFCLFMMVS